MYLSTSTRRIFLRALAATAIVAPAFNRMARAQGPSLVRVVSSYPADFTARVEAAFEKAYPQYRMQLIWRMSKDAAFYLEDIGNAADIYWAASPQNFSRLSKQGRFLPLPRDVLSLPTHIGQAGLRDKDNTFMATEVAGFGFAIAPDLLKQAHLSEPRDWSDLTAPNWKGRIALPVPSQVGFAPPMIEIVLQAFGWEKGWATWNEIAGNAVLVNQGSEAISDRVRSGEQMVGLSIDFFINQAIANGAALKFIYPGHTGLNPGHVALMKGAQNPDGAAAFLKFLLSREGQALLADPDVRRLPVRPDAYPQSDNRIYNPFSAAENGGLTFDSDRARPRLALSSAIFQQMLVEPHDELIALWEAIHAGEGTGKDLTQVREILGKCPVSENTANDGALQDRFSSRLRSAATDHRSMEIEAEWSALCKRQREAALQSLLAI